MLSGVVCKKCWSELVVNDEMARHCGNCGYDWSGEVPDVIEIEAFKKLNKPQMYIFDADGTLMDRETGKWLPGVVERLDQLRAARPVHLAIATNQGGPACRDACWPWSGKYPLLEDVLSKYTAVAERIGAKLYMSLLYQVKSTGKSICPSDIADDDPRLNPEWRKPKPGMLLQAMADAGVTPAETVFIGDSADDKAAAEAAGCRFQWAQQEFSYVGNPQYDEVAAAKESYQESSRVKKERAANEAVWREAVAEQQAGGNRPMEYMMQLDGEIHNASQYEEWMDLQRHLRATIVLREDNLVFEIPPRSFLPWVMDTWDADPDGWKAFFNEAKRLMDGRTYEELLGSDLAGLLSEPLDTPMEYGMVSFYRADADGEMIYAHVWVGSPLGSRHAWMVQ